MESDFDKWNVIKKELDSPQITHKKVIEGSVYWVKIGRNVGSEIYGKGSDYRRPVLVVKKYSASFVGIPLSTKIKDNDYWFLCNKKAAAVLFYQIRTFDTKRVITKLYRLNNEEFEKIKEKAKEILFPSPKLGNP